MSLVRQINLMLTFLLELAMLAAIAFWGFQTGAGPALRILLGIGAPLGVAVFWGLFLAPKARFRVAATLYHVLTAILFVLASAALFVAGRQVLGATLLALFAVNRLAALLL